MGKTARAGRVDSGLLLALVGPPFLGSRLLTRDGGNGTKTPAAVAFLLGPPLAKAVAPTLEGDHGVHEEFDRALRSGGFDGGAEEFHRVMSGAEHLPHGWSVKASVHRYSPHAFRVTHNGVGHGPGGEPGMVQRTSTVYLPSSDEEWDRPEIHRESLDIQPQNAGLGGKMEASLHGLARRVADRGGKPVVQRMTANWEVGGYAWARAGFNFGTHEDREKIAERFKRVADEHHAAGRITGEQHAAIHRDVGAMVERRASPSEFANYDPHGQRFGDGGHPMGKHAMLGSEYDAYHITHPSGAAPLGKAAGAAPEEPRLRGGRLPRAEGDHAWTEFVHGRHDDALTAAIRAHQEEHGRHPEPHELARLALDHHARHHGFADGDGGTPVDVSGLVQPAAVKAVAFVVQEKAVDRRDVGTLPLEFGDGGRVSVGAAVVSGMIRDAARNTNGPAAEKPATPPTPKYDMTPTTKAPRAYGTSAARTAISRLAANHRAYASAYLDSLIVPPTSDPARQEAQAKEVWRLRSRVGNPRPIEDYVHEHLWTPDERLEEARNDLAGLERKKAWHEEQLTTARGGQKLHHRTRIRDLGWQIEHQRDRHVARIEAEHRDWVAAGSRPSDFRPPAAAAVTKAMDRRDGGTLGMDFDRPAMPPLAEVGGTRKVREQYHPSRKRHMTLYHVWFRDGKHADEAWGSTKDEAIEQVRSWRQGREHRSLIAEHERKNLMGAAGLSKGLVLAFVMKAAGAVSEAEPRKSGPGRLLSIEDLNRLVTPEMLSRYRAALREAASITDTEPTPAQREAENYRKGRVRIHGLTIAIENPKGSYRRGTDKGGKEWKVRMGCHYGYFLRSHGSDKTPYGRDGDPVDVFVGPHPESELVFIVDQVNRDGAFDEHKCVCGCKNEAEARAVYLGCYSPGWTGLGDITPMTMPDFKKWLRESSKDKPVSHRLRK